MPRLALDKPSKARQAEPYLLVSRQNCDSRLLSFANNLEKCVINLDQAGVRIWLITIQMCKNGLKRWLFKRCGSSSHL